MQRAKIEPLIIPKEELDELKTKLADPILPEVSKHNFMRQVTGTCHSCGQMPSKIAKYRRYGITLIEKYCDECLSKSIQQN